MTQIEQARMEGRVEMIDYLLDMFCRQEITMPVRMHLKNLKYSLKIKLDASNSNADSCANDVD